MASSPAEGARAVHVPLRCELGFERAPALPNAHCEQVIHIIFAAGLKHAIDEDDGVTERSSEVTL